MLVLSSRTARKGLSESTLCATATVSTVLSSSPPSAAWVCVGTGERGVASPALSASAAAPAAATSRNRRETGRTRSGARWWPSY
ncbi:hypothetical protein STENM223S_06926 [Streptomyces tendae]